MSRKDKRRQKVMSGRQDTNVSIAELTGVLRRICGLGGIETAASECRRCL